MKPRNMLPANEALLKARFPSVYNKILKAGDRMPDSFYFEGSGGKERLMIQRGEHAFCPYGDKSESHKTRKSLIQLSLIHI